MAKSKSTTTTKSKSSASASPEKRSSNKLVEQYRALRSEISKVTWPTRDEARQLTTAVMGVTVAIALFLFAIDAVFVESVKGIIDINYVWVGATVVLVALIGLAFYANGREV